MSQVRIKGGQVAETQAAAPQADTFTFKTGRGDEIVCGKPRGVLKLKLRNILSKDELDNDPELVGIATAALSIRSINGEQPRCTTKLQFETILQNNFADDTDLDTFMNEFQRFCNPEYAEFVEASLQEALEQGIVEGDELKTFMTKKLLAKQQADMEKVRLS